jgi:hypothetical protein
VAGSPFSRSIRHLYTARLLSERSFCAFDHKRPSWSTLAYNKARDIGVETAAAAAAVAATDTVNNCSLDQRGSEAASAKSLTRYDTPVIAEAYLNRSVGRPIQLTAETGIAVQQTRDSVVLLKGSRALIIIIINHLLQTTQFVMHLSFYSVPLSIKYRLKLGNVSTCWRQEETFAYLLRQKKLPTPQQVHA